MGKLKSVKAPPRFRPRPGQVDFTNIRWAPVINCVVMYRQKILLVKRNHRLKLYPEYWSGISGFLDDHQSLDAKVYEELRAEVGISRKSIKRLTRGQVFDQDEPKYHKTWIVHPILVEVSSDTIHLDGEAQEFRWVTKSEATKLKLLPGFTRVLRELLPWLVSTL